MGDWIADCLQSSTKLVRFKLVTQKKESKLVRDGERLLNVSSGIFRMWIVFTAFRNCLHGGTVDTLVLETSTERCADSISAEGTIGLLV